MSNSTVLVAAPRSGHSPDLWAPYLLIGAGCLTFLAAHFWCYHKRNQHRYLRQREEKQLKSGLMERRRVATLILARYQADLDTDQSNTEVHLPQTLSDNRDDISGDQDDSEHSQHSGTDETKEDTSTTTETAAAGTTWHSFEQSSDTAAAACTTWHSFKQFSNTAAANSAAPPRTWPSASDCRAAEGKITTRYPRSIQHVHSRGLGESPTSGITNAGDSPTVRACQSPPDVASHQRAAGIWLALLQEPNTGRLAERRRSRSAALAAENIRVPRHQPIHRPPAPSAPRSRVFYTDISSGTQCPGTPFHKSKFPKRRHDGSCVGDGGTPSTHHHSASRSFNQWRQFKAQQVENVHLTSFYNYGDGAPSDNYGCTSSCHQAAQPRTTFGCRDRQRLYSAHPGRSAADTHQSTHALSAVYHKDREPAQELQTAQNTSSLPGSSRGCLDQPALAIHRDTDTDPMPLHRDTDTDPLSLHRDTDTDPLSLHRDTDTDPLSLHRDTDTDPLSIHRDTDTDRDAGPETGVTNSRSSTYRGYLSRHDLVACTETASVTFGKRSSRADKLEPRQVYPAGSRRRDETKTTKPHITKIQSQSFPTYDFHLKAKVRSETRISEQSSFPSICETVSFHLHGPHNSWSRSGVAPLAHTPLVLENDMGGTTRAAPRLRVLDPKVMFNYSHKIYPPTLRD